MAQQVINIGSEKPYTSPYNSVGVEICSNLYTEISPSETTKAAYYYIKIPGLKLLSPAQNGIGGCRGMITTSDNTTYVCNSNTISKLQSNGTKTFIGKLNSNSGFISMADNGAQLMIVDGVNGWILDYGTQSFTQITDEFFPGNNGQDAPISVICIDTYFVVNVPNTNSYYWSNPSYQYLDDTTQLYNNYDPTVKNGYWTPLHSGQKIAKAGNILNLIDANNMVWLFGNNNIEVHYDSGNNPQTFSRYSGAIIEVGLASVRSVAKYANNIFWLGNDRNGAVGVFTNNSYSPVRISTRGIEQIIALMDSYDDCYGYVYSQAGHTFYVMQFLSAQKTLVFDIVTGAWHVRTYLDPITGLESCWKGMNSCFNWSENIVGDMDTDAYYWLDQEYYQNDNPFGTDVNYIKCQKTTPILFQNGNQVRINFLQVILQQGVGTNINTPQGVGQNPKIQIGISNDSGNNYHVERTAFIGALGNTGNRTRISNLGIGRNIVFKLTCTEPIQFILVGLIADINVGKH